MRAGAAWLALGLAACGDAAPRGTAVEVPTRPSPCAEGASGPTVPDLLRIARGVAQRLAEAHLGGWGHSLSWEKARERGLSREEYAFEGHWDLRHAVGEETHLSIGPDRTFTYAEGAVEVSRGTWEVRGDRIRLHHQVVCGRPFQGLEADATTTFSLAELHKE